MPQDGTERTTAAAARTPSDDADDRPDDPATTAGGTAKPAEVDAETVVERSSRLAVSLTAVCGYVLSFGAATGALFGLLGYALQALGLFPASMSGQLGAFAVYSLPLPCAAFLYLAMYDDADLVRPGWPEGHPPIVDAWLLVTLAFGLVTVALGSPAWPDPIRIGGWAAAGLAAYVAVPLWLARRCLRGPSWRLGGLTVLVAPLVSLAGLATLSSWGDLHAYLLARSLRGNLPRLTPDGWFAVVAAIAAAVAVVGTALPYLFASRSPGPEAIGRRAAGALGRVAGSLRAGVGRLLGRG